MANTRADTALLGARAAVAVAMVPFALVTLAAATSAAAGADAVAAATMNADRSPVTLLGDDTPAYLPGSTPELGDRRTLAKKGGCNPKKNTSCCRAPRRTPPRAAPPATHRGRRSTLLMDPLPPAGDKKSKCVKQVFGDPLKPWKSGKPTKCAEGPSHKDPRREPGKKRGGGSGERGRGCRRRG